MERPITPHEAEELEIRESIDHQYAHCKVVPIRANLGHLTLVQTLPDNVFLEKNKPYIPDIPA